MRRVKKGATLLEVVMALAIIAIMIIPLMNSLLTSVSANKKGEEVQDAKLISQQVVENLRLEDQIEAGIIRTGNMELTLGAEQIEGTKKYYPVTSTEVGGFSVEGKIYEEATSKINDADSTKKYIDKQLGALIVLTEDSVYYSDASYKDKTIKEIFEAEKILAESSATSKLKKRVATAGATIKIDFNNIASTSKGEKYDILMDNRSLSTSTSYGVGIYVTEENNFDFKFENNSNKAQDIYIFRDSDVTKDDGTLSGKIETIGLFNKYTNIILNSNDGKKGLYTAELDIKRKNKVLESTESQFYLEE